MGLNDWLGTFAKAEGLDLSSDLEQAYEAALMIQGLELEYFNDRPVRTDVNLGLPQATQTQIFRRFRSALEICRALLSSIERQRAQLDSQELRQLQLTSLPRRAEGLLESVRRVRGEGCLRGGVPRGGAPDGRLDVPRRAPLRSTAHGPRGAPRRRRDPSAGDGSNPAQGGAAAAAKASSFNVIIIVRDLLLLRWIVHSSVLCTLVS